MSPQSLCGGGGVTAAGANQIGCLPEMAMTLTSQHMDDIQETGGSCSFSLIGSRSLTRCFYRSVHRGERRL